MKMNEALNILKPEGNTEKDIKAAYKKAAKKYHPDFGGDLELMKLVNLAYEFLMENRWFTAKHQETANMGADILDEILNIWETIKDFRGVKGEVCGTWLWVTGRTYPFRTRLNELGLKWAPKKKAWYWKPADEYKRTKKEFALDDIRGMFGTFELEKSKVFELAQ